MNQISKKQSCSKHNGLEYVALNLNQKDMQNKYFCLQCLAENQKQKTILITQSLDQIEEIKLNLKQERKKQQDRNEQIVKEMLDNVQNLKNIYIQQFEKISCTLEKWIQMIQNQEEEFIKKLDSAEIIDVQQFIIFAQQENSQKLSYDQEIKSELKNKFIELTENNLVKNCIEILSNMEQIANKFQSNDNDDEDELYLECDLHKNQKIILLDLVEKRALEKRIACSECVDEIPSNSYKSIKFVKDKWQKVQIEKQENMNNNTNILQQKVDQIIDCFDQIKLNYQLIIEGLQKKITQNFAEYLEQVRAKSLILKQNWTNLKKQQICEIAEQLSKKNKSNLTEDPLINLFKQQNKFINKSVKDTLLNLQECEIIQLKKINFSKNPLRFSELEKIVIDQLGEEEIEMDSVQQRIETENPKLGISITYNYLQSHLPYELQKNKSLKQYNWCHAIAFNQDCSIMLAGCNEQINIYNFDGQIRNQIQVLSEHSGSVTCLQFMNITNSFISASADSTIILWFDNLNNFWFCQQKLQGHTYQINCLIINKNDDTIFSCGDDQKIVIWNNDIKWEASQCILDHTSSVYGLSLNVSQNRLISCGFDHFILVFEYSENQNKWNQVQKIQTNIGGYRLGFITDNLFTFQPINQDIMEAYSMDQNNKYVKTTAIAIKKGFDQNCFFPLQYIESKQIIVNKSGSNINIIKIHESGQLTVEQFIQFETNYIFGKASDNGEYLVTWDYITKELQVRKYLE
ncbi:unnamed protein product [Paramecium sonneborni]|uniref:WD40-repeat-containing domain n=1 Tax=Paramecium sonneborni TaxID=65129 RepID=A0A8S1P1T4_9CILI|nr:unnamed protein product [Paramecium sonneborni]